MGTTPERCPQGEQRNSETGARVVRLNEKEQGLKETQYSHNVIEVASFESANNFK